MLVTMIYAWSAAHLIAISLAALAIARSRRSAAASRLTTLYVSAAAMTPPLIALILIVVLFIVGGSSPVAQMAGESGRGSWRLWFEAWPILLLGCGIAALMSAVLVVCPPYPPRGVYSWLSRLGTLVAAVLSAFTVLKLFPDA